jgi:hypothetical protein
MAALRLTDTRYLSSLAACLSVSLYLSTYLCLPFSLSLSISLSPYLSLTHLSQECPITKHGLCNSHGHCAYDKISRQAYCYCNEGYGGSSCSEQESSESYDGLTVQIILLVTLLLITIALGGVIAFMIYRVTALRKERLLENSAEYSVLPGGDKQTELTGSARF